MKLISLAALLVALSAPAMAFDLKATIGAGQSQGSTVGGAGSTSSVGGGSALFGTTSANAANVSSSSGAVQAQNKTGNLSNTSTVEQSFTSGSLSTGNSTSLGLAGSVFGANGQAASQGGGHASGGYVGAHLHF